MNTEMSRTPICRISCEMALLTKESPYHALLYRAYIPVCICFFSMTIGIVVTGVAVIDINRCVRVCVCVCV